VARTQGAARVIVAAPIAPPGAVHELGEVADDVVVLASPRSFMAIGQFYDDFSQTPDAEVVRLLEHTRTRSHQGVDDEVNVDSGDAKLAGRLTVPHGTREIVLFAHGSGSSRLSERNQFVAGVLNRSGLGTLLFDLLTPAEARDRGNVFDIALLGRRLAGAAQWVREQPAAPGASLGYFGASTGAAAALWAAAMPDLGPDLEIAAVVSRGGRPDLAGSRLRDVHAPTLLIVGSLDPEVLELNRRAAAEMHCENALEIVPGASHLFAEPGTLSHAANLARDWFANHLTSVRSR
jgi:putative phosphoribosyl transferase